MRKFLSSLTFVALASVVPSSTVFAAEITQPKAVVELFTSQGCYSCPAADKIIAEYAKKPEVLGLSWHVDYWDYLGWKDVFASKSNTQRQYRYAKSLKESQVYTPQAIINGQMHAVGSKKEKITEAINALSDSNRGMLVPINAKVVDKTIEIGVTSSEETADTTLYMVFFNKKHDVDIKRGENAGKTLSYHYVVHDSQVLGMVKADGLEMRFPLSEMTRMGYDGCALLLQKNDPDGNPQAILGATVITGL